MWRSNPRTFGAFFALAFVFLTLAHGQQSTPSFRERNVGIDTCQVFEFLSDSQTGVKATWSGACKGGFAEGLGIKRRYVGSPPRLVSVHKAEMSRGNQVHDGKHEDRVLLVDGSKLLYGQGDGPLRAISVAELPQWASDFAKVAVSPNVQNSAVNIKGAGPASIPEVFQACKTRLYYNSVNATGVSAIEYFAPRKAGEISRGLEMQTTGLVYPTRLSLAAGSSHPIANVYVWKDTFGQLKCELL